MFLSISITLISISVLTISILAIIVGLVLGITAEKFKVITDDRIDQVKNCLAGSNCGGCNYPGCDACAEAIVKGEAPINACAAANTSEIAKILNVENDAATKKIAFVKCSGNAVTTKSYYNYTDERSCRIEYTAQGHGAKICTYSCCGNGDCVKACKFDAINVINGLAVVNPHKCVGCSACIKVCPSGIIELIPLKTTYMVACSSCDKGKEVRVACTAGCIGCGICAKFCPQNAITVSDNLAHINQDLCSSCGTCASKCPAKVIKQVF